MQNTIRHTLQNGRTLDIAEMFIDFSQTPMSQLRRDRKLFRELTEIVAIGALETIRKSQLSAGTSSHVVNTLNAFIDRIALREDFFDRSVEISEPTSSVGEKYLVDVDPVRCIRLFQLVGPFSDWTHERLFYTTELSDELQPTLRVLSFIQALRKDGVLRAAHGRKLAVVANQLTPEQLQNIVVSSKVPEFLADAQRTADDLFSNQLSQLKTAAVFDQILHGEPAEDVLLQIERFFTQFDLNQKLKAVNHAVDMRAYETTKRFLQEWSEDILPAEEYRLFKHAVHSLDPDVVDCFRPYYMTIPKNTRQNVVSQLIQFDTVTVGHKVGKPTCFPVVRKLIDFGEPAQPVADQLVRYNSAGSRQLLVDLASDGLVDLQKLTSSLAHLSHADIDELVLGGLSVDQLFEVYHENYNDAKKVTREETEAFINSIERLHILETNNIRALKDPEKFRLLYQSQAFSHLVRTEVPVTKSTLNAILNDANARAASRPLL